MACYKKAAGEILPFTIAQEAELAQQNRHF
jgi:hypothetical protein